MGVISFIGRCGGLMVIRWILNLAVCSLRNRLVRWGGEGKKMKKELPPISFPQIISPPFDAY